VAWKAFSRDAGVVLLFLMLLVGGILLFRF
jgi:hypothetical protein